MLINRSLAVAPMLDYTDRHFRWFVRRITRRTLLYTEMVTTGALLHGGDRERFLGFDDDEHPVALQLGGSDPRELADCARLGAERGYDEINLNVGCPSDRVQSGRFGACLMAEPALVADCVKAMRDAVEVPVTVKHRIGIDERDSYEALCDFVGTVAAAGCDAVVVHARKAWLSGLSPKENRTVPPLRYDLVHRLKRDFPGLTIVINGGIESLDAAQAQLGHLDGAMLGRAAYHDPWVLAEADARIFGEAPRQLSRREVAEAMLPYIAAQAAAGVPVSRITRHLLGLFHGVPGARAWRRALSGSGTGPESASGPASGSGPRSESGSGEQALTTYRAALTRLPP
jgi:tRNA-dihydrouridine synthase A